MSGKKKPTVSEETSLEDAVGQLYPAAAEADAENKNLPPSPSWAPMLEDVAIADLICDEHTQVRAAENEEAIENYAEAMGNGAKFPPPIVFRDQDGKLWVSGGHHTIKATLRRGLARITVEIRRGTAKDARLHAYTSNLTHGVQLTNADKRKIVEGLIRDTDWKDRRIADEVRFWSHEKVRGVRREMSGKKWKRTERASSEADFVNVAQAIDIDTIIAQETGIVLDDDIEPSELFKWKRRKPGPAMDETKLRTIAEQLVTEVEAAGHSFIFDAQTRTVSVAIKRGAVIAAYHCQILMENLIET